MPPEPFDSRAKAPPAKRSEKGYGDENDFSMAATVRFAVEVVVAGFQGKRVYKNAFLMSS